MPDVKRKDVRQMQLGKPSCADDVKAHAARHVHLEQTRPAFGLEVEEPNGAAGMLGPSTGSSYRPVSAQIERAEATRRIPAAAVDPAGRGVERVTPFRFENTEVRPGPGQ
jgi:hypothetical protein